jgi:formylmethanofuran--tetrahydromethanopterin N-formyltransferase
LTKEKLVEDTYAEAFEGVYCRIIVTADDDETLRKAALQATATPSIVIGRIEGGIERVVKRKRNARQP